MDLEGFKCVEHRLHTGRPPCFPEGVWGCLLLVSQMAPEPGYLLAFYLLEMLTISYHSPLQQ